VDQYTSCIEIQRVLCASSVRVGICGVCVCSGNCKNQNGGGGGGGGQSGFCPTPPLPAEFSMNVVEPWSVFLAIELSHFRGGGIGMIRIRCFSGIQIQIQLDLDTARYVTCHIEQHSLWEILMDIR